MAMQASARGETSKPLPPSLRFCIKSASQAYPASQNQSQTPRQTIQEGLVFRVGAHSRRNEAFHCKRIGSRILRRLGKRCQLVGTAARPKKGRITAQRRNCWPRRRSRWPNRERSQVPAQGPCGGLSVRADNRRDPEARQYREICIRIRTLAHANGGAISTGEAAAARKHL